MSLEPDWTPCPHHKYKVTKLPNGNEESHLEFERAIKYRQYANEDKRKKPKSLDDVREEAITAHRKTELQILNSEIDQ